MTKVLFLLSIWFFCFISFFLRKFKNKKQKKINTIAYFPAFFEGNAGFHWRVKKWNELLNENEKKSEMFFALSQKDWLKISSGNQITALKIIIRRFYQIIKTQSFSTVIVRREILPFNDYGNLFLEKLLIHYHPNAFLDIDDDLAAAKNQPKKITNIYARLCLENGDKFNESLKIYRNFLVASKYLKGKVKIINPESRKITIIPTCVDYNKFEIKKHNNSIPIIGWIGGDHNYPQLDRLLPVLNDIGKEHRFKLVVIGGNDYKRTNINFDLEFKKWSLTNEKENINGFDIGIMPLDNSEQSKGKGGFKLIQYLGMGVAPIASNITINKDILINEKYGFLANDDDEWRRYLIKLLINKGLRKSISEKGKIRAAEYYSFDANKRKYQDAIHSNSSNKLNL